MTDLRPGFDEELASSPPPHHFTVVGQWALTTPSDLARVRHRVHDVATAHLDASASDRARMVDALVLATSELATNALHHGRPPAVVELGVDGTAVLLDVADHHPDAQPVISGRRASGAGGFGLLITRRLADGVGWYTTPTTKHVWAFFDAARTRPQ